MITKDEKHIIAITMAVMTGVMTLSTTGLSVYAESAPTSTQNVEVGKRYETNISSAKDIPKYQFTPETTGRYHFYSEGNEDTYGYVYDANQNLISSDNDNGEELNFSMDMNCEAGETYYLAASYFMEEQTGTIQWKVEQEDTEIQESSNITSEFQNGKDVDIQEETYSESEKLSAPVEKNSEGDYEFADLSDGTVEITGYTGNDISIKIPGTLAGKEVSSIGEAAFKNNKEIKSVEIPKSVTSLQYMSFDSCDELMDVSFEGESRLKSIEKYAFFYCTNLKNVALPNGIEKIGEVQFNTTDVIESKGTYNGWYYVKKGQLQTGQITVKGNKNGWWYIDKNGRVNFNFTGLAKNESGIWYCKKGQVQFGTTDVIESKGTYNGWYYVKKGQLQTGKETVEQNSTGWWYINKDGKVDFNFNGLAKNGNGIWYCKKGKVQFNATDVLYSKGTYEGWYYVKKGQLQTGKVTVEQNSTGWWYIAKDGKVDFSFTGIASNAYGSWYLEKGKVNFNKNISAYTDPHTKLLYKVVKGKATRIKEHVYTESKRDLQYIYYKCKDCGATKKEFNDQTYTIDLGNGKTTTVVGHFDLEMRQEILDLVNKKRVIWGSKLLSLPPMESSLQNAANIRAYEIIYSYSHTRPNGERGITSFNVDGENLAEGFTSASDVCQAWFSSESHFRNITNNSYNTMGVGVFCAKTDYGYENYFSQMFSCDKLE